MPLIFIAAIIVLALVIVLFLRARKKPTVMRYGDLRDQFFSEAEHTSSRGPAPARPANLDTRLPAAKAAQLRTLFPPTAETRKAFYKCYSEINASLSGELGAIDKNACWYELLSPGRRAILLAEALEAEVNNGGFDQYFLNSSGDGAALTPAALRLLAQEAAAALVERANALFPSGPPVDRTQRLKLMKTLGKPGSNLWSDLDTEFFDLNLPDEGLAIGSAVPYILSHESEFFRPD
jgi:hypothetical protein